DELASSAGGQLVGDSLAESIIYLCTLIADRPRAIDQYIDYFGDTRAHPLPSADESIAPVTILDAQGRVLRVVSAKEFRRARLVSASAGAAPRAVRSLSR